MDRWYRGTVLGLLVVCAFMLGTIVSLTKAQDARAETAASTPSMLAVTGEVGSGVSVLYVIDTEKKQLAVYNAAGGRELRFIAARRIKFDLELKEMNDKTARGASVDTLADLWRRSQPAETSGEKPPPRK